MISLKINYKKLDTEPERGFELEDDPRRRQVALVATIESDYRNSIRNCLPTLPLPDGISFTTSQKSIRVVEGDRKFLDLYQVLWAGADTISELERSAVPQLKHIC